MKSISSALSEKVFALSERVFALSERVFALDVRVECELMWQGQDEGPGIRPGKGQEPQQKRLRDARNSFSRWDKS